MALLYSLPVWAYYVIQLRSIRLLLGWLLLLGAISPCFVTEQQLTLVGSGPVSCCCTELYLPA